MLSYSTIYVRQILFQRERLLALMIGPRVTVIHVASNITASAKYDYRAAESVVLNAVYPSL